MNEANPAQLAPYVSGGAFALAVALLGSGCGSKTLIRIGGGNLKSLVVYVFLGIAAYMTLRGLFGAFRASVLDAVSLTLAPGQDLPSLLAAATGVVTGLVVVGGWYVSGKLGYIAEDPQSLQEAFVAMVAGSAATMKYQYWRISS